MIKLIFIMETRSKSKTDWMYVKSTIDYYYKPRTFRILKIFAKCKTELIKQDVKIQNELDSFNKTNKVIIIADYDREEETNNSIVKYCQKNNYELIWMNLDVEDVYLQKQINNRFKTKEAYDFQRKKNKLLLNLKSNLSVDNPLTRRHSSNILNILDKYLERL